MIPENIKLIIERLEQELKYDKSMRIELAKLANNLTLQNQRLRKQLIAFKCK